MLFAVFVTQSHGNRAGPVFDRRTVDREAEGFLTQGLDRIRSTGGAAGAILAIEVGDLAGGQGLATEGIEGHATIGLRDGVAADDLASGVGDRILRQVEARDVAVRVVGAWRKGRARQGHVVDLDAGVGFAVLEVGIPGPALAEQVEAAVTTHHIAAHGAHQEHLLVGGDIGPVRTVGDVGCSGSIVEGGGANRIGRLVEARVHVRKALRDAVEQARSEQVGVVAMGVHAILGRIALRRNVLGTAHAVVQGGVDFRRRRQVIGHAGIDVAAGQGVIQTLGELMRIVLVARIGRCA